MRGSIEYKVFLGMKKKHVTDGFNGVTVDLIDEKRLYFIIDTDINPNALDIIPSNPAFLEVNKSDYLFVKALNICLIGDTKT